MPTRTRSRTAPLDASVSYRPYQYYSDGVLVSQHNERTADWATKPNEQMEDVVTPEFYKKIRSGSFITNDLVHTKHWNSNVGLVTGSKSRTIPGRYGNPPRTISEVWTQPLTVPPPSSSIFDDAEFSISQELAIRKCFDNATQPLAQSLVSIAEWRKTLDLVVGLKRRFARTAITLMNKNRRTFKRVMDGAGSHWLEARYGFRPTAYDILDHINAAKDPKVWGRIYRAEGWNEREINESETTPQGWYTPWSGMINMSDSLSVKQQSRAICLYKLNPAVETAFATNFGLTNFVSTGYELVPFSFMLDWVTDIGGWISTLENIRHLDVVSSCSVDRREAIHTRTVQGSQATSRVWQTVRDGNILHRVFSPPPINIRFDMLKGVDTFFIARNLLGKKGKFI